MQAVETHMGSGEDVAACIGNARTQEMQDTLLRCLPSFHRRAYRYLGNAADAEDAVQDALLAAYKHLGQFKGQAQLSTWLTAIVTNSARMQLRRRPREIHLSLDEQLGDEEQFCLSQRLADRGPTPEEECRKSELRERLIQFLPQLSPPLRKAFQLRDLDGLTTRETARFLGVTDGTVKAQLARARTKLVRLMSRSLDAPLRSRLSGAALPAGQSSSRHRSRFSQGRYQYRAHPAKIAAAGNSGSASGGTGSELAAAGN
jgi:RNA polymerase sigma-70 factor (ECF subfamily)